MKIQDIFKLPDNKGKAKLFNRIMNRYGIPKEDSKELKNNIDNYSSSKDEYYYYKFATLSIDTILEIGNMVLTVADELYINGILYFNKIDGQVGPVDSPFYNWAIVNGIGDFSTNEYMNLYIKMNKKPTYLTTFKGGEFLKFEFTGNLYDRLIKLDNDAAIEELKSMLMEATEEEYNNVWKN